MRYLPLKPRLQRLYMSTHTAIDMRWHEEKRVDDDVMWHPADGKAWKKFDPKFLKFAADSRNVRLGLSTDRFNMFGVLNQHHSTWPIFLFPYNLPPWKCMNKEYMMMTLLIIEDLGRSIDVYLWPLLDELKDLWTHGVRTYDKGTGMMFTLHAAVMWTVNDFPAYAMVSGWLPWDHEWREKDKEFDGEKEHRLRPREWSGAQILEQLNRLDFAPFGTNVNIEGRTKDTIKAHLDLERMGIRRGLWMNRDNDKARRDLAFFSMKPNDKKEILKFLSSIKFPDGLLGDLKKSVRNKAKPEGSIIQTWVAYEVLTFCGMYLKDVETNFNRPLRNNDGGVNQLKALNCPTYSEELYNLEFRSIRVELYLGFHVNDVKFLLGARDDKLCMQNSGVHVPGGDESTNIEFYGKLTSVVQLLYKDWCQVILLQCRWFVTNPNRHGSVKRDYGLLSVNTTKTWYDDDPYILASMAKQSVYLDDPKAGRGWKVVQTMDHMNMYAIPKQDRTDDDIDNVADQRLESLMKSGVETL
ncbi:unnamed protein product [Malus baccata var. baccata]